MPEVPQPNAHEERLNEVRLDQGIYDQVMADAEVAGVWPEAPEVNTRHLSEAVKTEKTRRSPAVPGLERGAISGRDQGRLIANEEYEKALAEGRVGKPLSDEGLAAKEKTFQIARRIAHSRAVTDEDFLSLPAHQQMAILRAREEKRERKA